MDIKCLNLTNKMINSKEIMNKNLSKNFLYPSHGEIHMSKSGADFIAINVFNWLKQINDYMH